MWLWALAWAVMIALFTVPSVPQYRRGELVVPASFMGLTFVPFLYGLSRSGLAVYPLIFCLIWYFLLLAVLLDVESRIRRGIPS